MTTSPNLETAAAAGAIPLESDPEQFALRSGPHWDSFEQFRMGGPKQLEAGLGRGQVGELRVKGRDYVIMERETFNQLYGLAQDIRRLRHAMVLVRQAAQLVLHTSGARMAIEHLRDLTAYLPGLTTERAAAPRELAFDEDEREDDVEGESAGEEPGFELDPGRVRRPAFAVSE